ncbi:hypothetical protein UFVDC4_00173 [Staphylococcus phage vB_SauM-UFV_DC4]|nr:hypothetical protein UFVDC4_00173 [Staphylococcus phage vB_SauM-UFV_DC4]
MKKIYGFKIKYNKKVVDTFTFESFEEAMNKLELSLLEIYDSEDFTTMQLILNTYDIEEINEDSFKDKLRLNHLNHIKNFSIELFSKYINTDKEEGIA